MAGQQPFDPDDYPAILKPSEVAAWLRLSPRMIQLMAKDGRLPAMQIPGVRGYRFLKDDILAFIDESLPKHRRVDDAAETSADHEVHA